MDEAFPLPDLSDDDTRPFWDAAQRGELAVPRCDACGRWCWFPRTTCRGCGATSLTWTAVSGRGSLYSWAVVRHAFLPAFADKVPFVSGLVALDEDPAVRIVTNLVDCEPDELVPDSAVEVTFRPLTFGGRTITAPFFRPVGR